MIETGVVVDIKDGAITIRQDKFSSGDHCFGCMNYECKRKHGYISVVNQANLPLKTGQKVEVEIRTASIAGQALKALLPLMLGFASGFWLAGFIFPSAAEGARAFGGLILMLAAGSGVYLFRRRFPAKTLISIKKQ